MEEFEIKFLEVNVPELEKKLVSIGAEKVGEYDYSRMLLDYPDARLNRAHSWLRLRTDGSHTTLAYKNSQKLDKDNVEVGMQEIEIVVDDYQKTSEILKNIGLEVMREEKNRRVRYKKSAVIFDIDFWPGIPAYLEIEAPSFAEAKEAASELGFESSKGLICTPAKVYASYGYNVHDYSSITFDGFVKK